MKIIILIVALACASATDKKDEVTTKTASEQSKDKRQTQGEVVISAPAHLVYRTARRHKEQVAPVEEEQEDDKPSPNNRAGISEEYRPGQVFSLNTQELLQLQSERRAPVSSNQNLQQLYSTDPLPEHKQNLQQLYSTDSVPEHKQNLQQFYILEPQLSHQVQLQPSHAVIARPSYSSNGGEASVGAALSVSDSGSNNFDQDLLALLGHAPVRPEEQRVQAYTLAPQTTSQNTAQQYSQIERYITKPIKKVMKIRPKAQVVPTPVAAAPQQYLIETTNIQQQPQQQLQPQFYQQLQRRPTQQPRPAQSLRYVPFSTAQPAYYPTSENQGIKIVAAPNLQQSQGQIAYRIIPQYQQPEASPKQFRVIDSPHPQSVRPDVSRVPASSIDRPITYHKRYPEVEKPRSVKFFEQATTPENSNNIPQSAQIVGDHYYIRPIYRATEQRGRYQLAQFAVGSMDQSRTLEPTKASHSAIYVSKSAVPKKVNPTPLIRVDQPVRDQHLRVEQPSRNEQQVRVELNEHSLEEQRSRLPPPRNNKAYTPQEFAALVQAGYSVTPIPVSSYRNPLPVQYAQSRSSVEPSAAPTNRRVLYSRRHQYLPLRGDDAP